MKNLFAEISKVEELEDGTVNVYGIASSEARDHDGELIRSTAVKAALPEWLTFGNIREMHQPIAAGTAIEAHVDDSGMTHLAAHIVDPTSVKKVREKVLKGFSLGGKVTKRNATDKSIIEGLRITEISLVDRPANPDSLISLVKFDNAGRRKMEKTQKTDDQVNKGMWDIGRLADLITSLFWLADGAISEAAVEGDGSDVGARIKSVVATLVECLRDMVDEETAELLGLNGTIESAAKAIQSPAVVDRLAKAGKKFSRSTVAQLAAVHKGMKDCCEMLDKLGYDKADNPEDEDAMTDKELNDKVAKAVGDATSTLQKSVDDLTKSVGELKTANETLTAENKTLKADLEKAQGEAKAQKEIADGIAKAAVEKGFVKPVPKTADAGGQTPASDLPKPGDPIAKTADGKPDFNKELRGSFARPMAPVRGVSLSK